MVLFLSQTVLSASVCTDPTKGPLCFNMKYLRSQVMAIGAQRELMQINYPYLESIGHEIDDTATNIRQNGLLGSLHDAGIVEIQSKAQSLIVEAKEQDPMALATSNVIQKKCAACHSSASPVSGIDWDQIFKSDWENIAKNCAREGRTPYLCRSMNGMLSAYSGILASSELGRKNFTALKYSALEIARISSDLQVKKVFHVTDPLGIVQTKAEEVVRLASEQNPEAYEKGLQITQSCMQCHGTYALSKPMGMNISTFKVIK